jgi:hypothetical protein
VAVAAAESECRAREEDEDSELGDVGSIGPDEAEFLEDDLEGEPIRQLIVADHTLPSIPNPAPSDGKVPPACLLLFLTLRDVSPGTPQNPAPRALPL